VQDIVVRRRLASHMLVEELMIAANVAAARALAEKKRPCLFRVHDKPDPIRIEALAQYLERLGIGWSRTAKKPGDFTRMLERIVEPSLREQVSGFVLRAQAQAMYQPDNLGHFGLNLRHYAHFTSPIRRYSDLVVHRLLIHHEKLAGANDGRAYDVEQLERFGRLVSATERKAVQAERMAFARYTALFMLDKKGAQFTGRVIGVQRFGLFVMLDETGAEGLVPVSTLGEDAFHFDEQHQALVGIRYGEAFGLGDLVTVTLADIDIVQGQLSFRIDVHERAHAAELARAAWAKAGPMRRGRQTRGRPPHAAPAAASAEALRRRTLELAALMASACIVGASLALSFPLLSLVLEASGAGPAAIGLNAAAHGLGVVLAAPFFGRAIQGVGAARVMRYGLAAAAGLLVLFSLHVDLASGSCCACSSALPPPPSSSSARPPSTRWSRTTAAAACSASTAPCSPSATPPGR
jgi:predicted RNA-binding protein with RPS1 domain